MGRRNRERIERIRAGLELPIAVKEHLTPTLLEYGKVILTCCWCGNPVLSTDIREHANTCWGVNIGAGESVPFVRSKEHLGHWIAWRKQQEEILKV